MSAARLLPHYAAVIDFIMDSTQRRLCGHEAARRFDTCPPGELSTKPKRFNGNRRRKSGMLHGYDEKAALVIGRPTPSRGIISRMADGAVV